MKKTEVKCDQCENLFFKLNKEINRCVKKQMGNYCSISCVAKYRNSLMTKEYWKNQYIKKSKNKKFFIKSSR